MFFCSLKKTLWLSPIKNIKQVLNPAFLKQNPNRAEIELFKKEFCKLLENVNLNESEEFHKNLIKDFLNAVYYKDKHYINTKGRSDLVIHNENSTASPVGVLIETKSPTNKTEMIRRGEPAYSPDLNVKSFHELLLYYLRERKTGKNFELRYLIITNVYEWFVFDAQDFEKLFYQNKKLVSSFEQFEAGKLSGTSTDFFYKEIAAPMVAGQAEIPFTHFDLRDYYNQNINDENFTVLYKFLSPVHLLKRDVLPDNTKLNKEFYNELLHILGLVENEAEGKIKIERKSSQTRDAGSLLELTITALETNDISQINDLDSYGDNSEEQVFGVAFSLIITWINRILFLKLLEAQLLKYHNNHTDYAFLLPDKITNYHKLNTLFFQILAQPHNKRQENVKEFAQIPYLNSSLFEETELEKTLKIYALSQDTELPFYGKTVLPHQKVNALSYLLQFLQAYNFSGQLEAGDDPNKLISAAVLGLIFEKINGYKDGSFFTPSFITMYMCRETIGRAVVQKFNEEKGWNCQTITELHNCIYSRFTRHYDGIAGQARHDDRNDDSNDNPLVEANFIFNSIRICDPAVGSGHFLVSALNEMIYLKSELGILADENHKTLNAYTINIENDELTVTHDGEHFKYVPENRESLRVQKTLFHEKQTLIENCLFGVDINPNSVKICQLRLWIELLKNAYYIIENGELKIENEKNNFRFKILQTLPNIDINIKCGNSLMSRFDLHDTYNDNHSLQKEVRDNTKQYRDLITIYKCMNDKITKKRIREDIVRVKYNLNDAFNFRDIDYTKWQVVRAKTTDLFTMYHENENNAWTEKMKQLQAEETNLREKYEQKIASYVNAFEWRFEFPEVLDDDGNFIGFDVVIGNPPYINIKNNKRYYNYKTYQCLELYAFFFERSFDLLNKKGLIAFITGSLYLKGVKYQSLRDFLTANFDLLQLSNVGDNVFKHVKMPTTIFIGNKYATSTWNFEDKNNDFSLLEKIEKNTVPISKISKIMRGLELGRDKINANGDIPFITGSNICQYGITKLSYIDEETLNNFSKEKIFFEKERILMRETGSTITALFLDYLLYSNRSLFSILITDNQFDIKFVLGCLNSKVLQFYYQTKFKAETNLFPKIRIIQAKKLPIPNISLEQQQPIITFVNQILSAKKENPLADTKKLEEKIDGLVYALYELTEEEIKITEK